MLTEEREVAYRTGTETLIKHMEEYSVSEPKAVLVISVTEDGSVLVNGNTGRIMALGIIEYAKGMIERGEV